jgi:endonuclease/exonuclease/phosphatase family metal-dependent hydrolase
MNYIRFIVCLALAVALSSTAEETAQPIRLRVLTYNIHHGAGMDRKLDLERIARVIRDQKPDFVALQEVHSKTRLVKKIDQAAELGRLTGMYAAFGKAMDYNGGEYGEAVLSRWPIREQRTIPLSAGPGHEPRAALWIRVTLPDGAGDLDFIGTHLDHLKTEQRIGQINDLNQGALNTNAIPCILAGDFNTSPDTPEHKLLKRDWAEAGADVSEATYPADSPQIKIDYVWFRPAKSFRTVEARVVEEKVASDHRPVLAILELIR